MTASVITHPRALQGAARAVQRELNAVRDTCFNMERIENEVMQAAAVRRLELAIDYLLEMERAR